MDSWLVSETAWLRIGVTLFFVNAALVLFAPHGRLRSEQTTHLLLLLSVTTIGIGLGLRWHQHGQGPFLTLHEILASNLFSLGLFFLVASLAVPAVRKASTVAIPMLAFLGAWALYEPADVTPLPPTFDNPWLWAHVVAGKLFLGACMVAVSLSLILLAGHRQPRTRDESQLVDSLDGQVWRFAAIAFVCQSFMLVAGAAWARDAWGRYWAWDPLETWALLTWLALAVVLHARVGLRLPRWSGWAGMCVVFVLAFLTFFGVPFLSIAPHKGVL